MAIAGSGSSRMRFGVGEALQATFDAIGANLGPMVVLGLLLVAAPALLVHIGGLLLHAGPFKVGGATPTQLVLVLVNFLTATVLQGALSLVVVRYLGGGRPRVADSIAAAAPFLIPLFGVACLSALAMVLAFLAAIVVIAIAIGAALGAAHMLQPSSGYAIGVVSALLGFIPVIFLWLMWSVAAPALIIEKGGVFGSMARSAALTRGARWSILWTIVVTMLLRLVLGVIGSGLVALTHMLLFTAAGAEVGTMAGVVTGVVVSTMTGLGSIFSAAAPAAIYSLLRQVKEGAGPQTLAAVFD